jgi:hypothetical protein
MGIKKMIYKVTLDIDKVMANKEEIERWLTANHAVYVEEDLPTARDMRVFGAPEMSRAFKDLILSVSHHVSTGSKYWISSALNKQQKKEPYAMDVRFENVDQMYRNYYFLDADMATLFKLTWG